MLLTDTNPSHIFNTDQNPGTIPGIQIQANYMEFECQTVRFDPDSHNFLTDRSQDSDSEPDKLSRKVIRPIIRNQNQQNDLEPYLEKLSGIGIGKMFRIRNTMGTGSGMLDLLCTAVPVTMIHITQPSSFIYSPSQKGMMEQCSAQTHTS